MRFGLKATIDSTIFAGSDISFDSDDLRLEFKRNEDGYLSEVVVSVAADPSAFDAKVEPGIGDAKLAISIQTDDALMDRMLSCLRRLESHIAFACAGALRRIHWDTVERFRIPDRDDERVGPLASIRLHYADQRPEVSADSEAFAIVAKASTVESPLVVPKAFWREAMNDYFERRYIQAFYNFYFVIEGFYADGKHGKSQVLAAFAKSTEFNEIVERAITLVIRDRFHFPRLDALYDELGCTLDRVGTQKLIFLLRGRLHHYSPDSPQEQPDPFAQEHFLSPAWLLMYLATAAIEKRDALPRVHLRGQPER